MNQSRYVGVVSSKQIETNGFYVAFGEKLGFGINDCMKGENYSSFDAFSLSVCLSICLCVCVCVCVS